MATQLKHRTVVFVGGGFTAALAARQLTAKGVDVVVLESGDDRTHSAATSLPSQRDELRWDVHGDLFQDWSVQTYTLRHDTGGTALPIRRLQAFKPGREWAVRPITGTARPGAGARMIRSCAPISRAGMERKLFQRTWRSRIGASPMPRSNPITTSSKSCSGSPARRATCAARRKKAGTPSKALGRTNTRRSRSRSPKQA